MEVDLLVLVVRFSGQLDLPTMPLAVLLTHVSCLLQYLPNSQGMQWIPPGAAELK
jgi:hypothetical protein